MSPFVAALGAQRHLIVKATSADKIQKISKKRSGTITRAQSKQPKAEESVVFSAPSLNSAVPVAEKSELKTPSANVNVIPISR